MAVIRAGYIGLPFFLCKLSLIMLHYFHNLKKSKKLQNNRKCPFSVKNLVQILHSKVIII